MPSYQMLYKGDGRLATDYSEETKQDTDDESNY